MRPSFHPVLLLLLGLALAFAGPSCDKRDAKQRCDYPEDCEDIETLPAGIVWTCPDELCEPIPCESSKGCIIETYCSKPDPTEANPEPDGWCVEGCRRDSDCYGGAFCRDGACEEEPCRSSQLDCWFGEFCSPVTQACEPAGAPFCSLCNPAEVVYSDPGTCERQAIGHPLCGDGNFCWGYPDNQTCGVACDDNSDCPAGFSCSSALFSDSTCPDELVSVGRFCLAESCAN